MAEQEVSNHGCGAARPRATLLLVDDHPVLRAGMAAVLSPGRQLQVLEAADVPGALQFITSYPDLAVVLYDWHLPAPGGCRGLRLIRALAPLLPVVVMSADEDDAIAVAAQQCGAQAFLPKSSELATIQRTLRPWLGAVFPAQGAPAVRATAAAASDPATDLTPRQLDVLRPLALGWSNKRIADRLAISEATVRAHVTEILKTLGVHNRTEAAIKTSSLGLVSRLPSDD